MKVGDKYIIEIEEVIRRNGAPQIARVKGFNALVFDKNGLEKLEPYDGEKVYLKGYENGYKNGKNAVMNESEEKHNSDLDYKDGLEDGRMEAWKCARKLCQSEKYGGLEEHCAEIFDRQDTFDVFDYSASEAIAKIKEYEEKQKQDADIKVGDEVTDHMGYKGVITRARQSDSEFVHWIRYDGCTYGSSEGSLVKTGRHFDTIAEVLAELGGKE